MPSRADGLRWIKFILPFLIAIALGLYPRSYAAESGLSRSGSVPAQTALQGLSRAAEELPWRMDLREQAGIAAFDVADDQTAVHWLSQAKTAGHISQAGLLAFGDALSRTGDPAGAIDAWQAAVQAPGQDHAPAYTRLEKIYRSIPDLAMLEKTLELHAEEYPQDASVAYQLGLVSTIENPDEALKILDRAESLDGALTDNVHDIQSGFLYAVNHDGPSLEMMLIGRALGEVEEWDLALQAFQRALDLDPVNAEALAFRGEALYHLGQDGQPDLEEAVRRDPDSYLIQGLQAVNWLRQGKPERALVYLHAVAAQDPQNPVWQAQIGDALAAMGNYDDAVSYYQSAASLAQTDATYWMLLARFCLKYQYQLNEIGLPAARQAVLLYDKNAAALDLMGQVLTSLGDTTSAQRFFERAISADPSASDAHLHLGMLLLQVGSHAEARQHLLLASKLQPESNAGQQAGRLLQQYFP